MKKRPFWIRKLPDSRESESIDWCVHSLIEQVATPVGTFSLFYGALNAGVQPHDVHTHVEEEFIMVLSGELEVLTGSNGEGTGAGGFIYHPPGQLHGIRCTVAGPARFLILRVLPPPGVLPANPPASLVADSRRLPAWGDQDGAQRQWLCQDHALAAGGTLNAFIARFAAFSGMRAHTDNYDGMLVLLSGKSHGLGHTTPAPAVLFYPAGTVHGWAAVNEEPWQALCFEFHHPPPPEQAMSAGIASIREIA